MGIQTMTVKERLYQAVIKRELKDKYEMNGDGITLSCISCGASEVVKDGILIQEHYRRCPTGQLERILAI